MAPFGPLAGTVTAPGTVMSGPRVSATVTVNDALA